jgi:hypothetical protein
MATIALVVEGDAEFSLGARAAERLATLGITNVTVLQGPGSTAILLEGWAFDMSGADVAAQAVFDGSSPSMRLLRPVLQIAVGDSVG